MLSGGVNVADAAFRATNEAILGQFAPEFVASLGEEHHFTPRSDAALLPQSIDPGSVCGIDGHVLSIYPSRRSGRSSCSLAAHYDIRLVPCDAIEKGAACCSSLGLTSSLPLPAILLRTICGSFSQGTAAADDPDSINLVTFDGASGRPSEPTAALEE